MEKKEIELSDPAQGKSYVDQLKPHLHQEKDREKGSAIEKIQLFWSHELLKVELLFYFEVRLYLLNFLSGFTTTQNCNLCQKHRMIPYAPFQAIKF